MICSKTVLDSSIPGVYFDSNGISNIYHQYQRVKGRKFNQSVVERIKRDGASKKYDCLLGLSGGLDSTYMLHKAVHDYGLRPLVVHVDAGWNSDLASRNINGIVDKLGLDLVTQVVPWKEEMVFQRALFKSGVPFLDIAQDHAFVSYIYKFAEENDIKYILNGGNIATEFVPMPFDLYYYGTDLKLIRDICRRFESFSFSNYPLTSPFNHKFRLRYFKGIKVVKPLNFDNYVVKDIITLLDKEYGYKYYGQKHFESRFTRFFEGYWLPERFGFDVRKCQYSSLILSGQMSRQEALDLLKKPALSGSEIDYEKSFLCSKLRITPEELEDYFMMPKRGFSDYKNQYLIFKSLEFIVDKLQIYRRGGAY